MHTFNFHDTPDKRTQKNPKTREDTALGALLKICYASALPKRFAKEPDLAKAGARAKESNPNPS